jgi:ferrous-iron efflux pump FieF
MSAELHPAHQAHGDLTRRAATASVSMAALLLLLKGYAAWATASVAMLGSLADTGLDLITSLITLYGVRLAAMPADREHRFGHGKAEAIAALIQVGVITFSALGIGWRAIDRLVSGSTTAHAEFGIAASVVAIAATLVLVLYQRRVIARTGSVAIRTDYIHYSSDLALNGSVIVALLLDQYLHIRAADPMLGLAIALWLIWSAWRASAHAIDQLMDKEWPEEKRRRFIEVAARHPELKGIHDLRTRSSGMHDFVQFHVWVDPAMTVAEAHEVMDEIEHKLEAEFPGCEVLIHPDPEGHVDHPGNALVETDLIQEAQEET